MDIWCVTAFLCSFIFIGGSIRPCLYVNSPDDELVEAARAGKVGAWTELVRRYYPLLRRYIVSRTGDPELAADLTQDVFLASGNLLDRLPVDRPFIAWLYRIAQNHLHHAWRRERLRHVISLEELAERPGPICPALRQSDELAVSVTEEAVVQLVLDEMHPALRNALILRSLKGFNAHEVAIILGISLLAAQRRISRARAEFRILYYALVTETDQQGSGKNCHGSRKATRRTLKRDTITAQ